MLYLFTGGSGSGKSACAEQKILSFGDCPRIYLATMAAADDESKARIRRHRAMRSEKNFMTIERYTDIGSFDLPSGYDSKNCCILLECVSNLTANEMYLPDGANENTVEKIISGICRLRSRFQEIVIVTNEVFSDLPIKDAETKRYLSYLGEINCALARMAETVTEVVYGIEVPLLPKWGSGADRIRKGDNENVCAPTVEQL